MFYTSTIKFINIVREGGEREREVDISEKQFDFRKGKYISPYLWTC